MTSQPDGNGCLPEDQWGIDRDPSVGGDAMRWRPEPAPGVPFLADVMRSRPNPLPRRRKRTDAQSRGEVNALWMAIGNAYRELTDA